MKTLLAGAMLLALNVPAYANPLPWSADTCVPYAEAVAALDGEGAHVLGAYPAPFTRTGDVLYFEFHGIVSAAGLAANRACAHFPATIIGRVNVNPATL